MSHMWLSLISWCIFAQNRIFTVTLNHSFYPGSVEDIRMYPTSSLLSYLVTGAVFRYKIFCQYWSEMSHSKNVINPYSLPVSQIKVKQLLWSKERNSEGYKQLSLLGFFSWQHGCYWILGNAKTSGSLTGKHPDVSLYHHSPSVFPV